MAKLSKLFECIQALMTDRLYGRVIISFSDGKITMIRTEKTVKLNDFKV